MDRQARIFVAGGDTLLGAVLIERLAQAGFEDLVGVPPHEPDLDDANHVEAFFQSVRPEYVFFAAGPSGGIEENRQQPADLMLDNLAMITNVMPAAFRAGVRKLLYLGSSCCYPREAAQPLRVESLATGPLEPTSEAYATAKLTGLTLCQAYRQQYDAPFITAIPANLYGPGDDFHADSGHVVPALINRLHKAQQHGTPAVTLWGTGRPRRDFLFVRDAADACVFLMEHYDAPRPINLGSGRDWSIAETAEMLADIIGYHGKLHFDTTQPDGMARKLLDSSDLFELGWRPSTAFRGGLETTYAWYLEHVAREVRHVRAAV